MENYNKSEEKEKKKVYGNVKKTVDLYCAVTSFFVVDCCYCYYNPKYGGNFSRLSE